MNEEIIDILRDEHNRRFKEINRLMTKGNSFSSLGITILFVLMTVGFQDNYSYIFLIIPLLGYWLGLEIIKTARDLMTSVKYTIIIENKINKYFNKNILIWESFIVKRHLASKPIQMFWNGISYVFLMGLIAVSSVMVYDKFNEIVFFIHLIISLFIVISSHILYIRFHKDMKGLEKKISKEFLKPVR